MADVENHRTLKLWLLMVVGSLAFSSVLMSWNPTITGYFAYDTGPEVTFNPDLISQDDYYAHGSETIFFVITIIAIQVVIYAFITKFYSKVEKEEETDLEKIIRNKKDE